MVMKIFYDLVFSDDDAAWYGLVYEFGIEGRRAIEGSGHDVYTTEMCQTKDKAEAAVKGNYPTASLVSVY